MRPTRQKCEIHFRPTKPPKLTFWPKLVPKFPAPVGLDDTFRVICINSFPTFYFWAASVICFGFDFSFRFHFTLPPTSETILHFIFTSFELPDFISFSLHFPTPSEIGTLRISTTCPTTCPTSKAPLPPPNHHPTTRHSHPARDRVPQAPPHARYMGALWR